jgi:hypothetical protein
MIVQGVCEEAGEGGLTEVPVKSDVSGRIEIYQRGAYTFAYRAVWVGSVAMDSGGFAFGGCLPDAIEGDLIWRMGQQPAASAGGFGGDEAVTAQTGEEAADDDRVRADAEGYEFRGEALVRLGGEQAENMDGERETGIHPLLMMHCRARILHRNGYGLFIRNFFCDEYVIRSSKKNGHICHGRWINASCVVWSYGKGRQPDFDRAAFARP